MMKCTCRIEYFDFGCVCGRMAIVDLSHMAVGKAVAFYPRTNGVKLRIVLYNMGVV